MNIAVHGFVLVLFSGVEERRSDEGRLFCMHDRKRNGTGQTNSFHQIQ